MHGASSLWGLDTRHLVALLTIERTRSISRAADELGYGQSAVSQQLAALERVVGQRLVERGMGPQPLTLTSAGKALLPYAEQILRSLTMAKDQLRALDVGDVGQLRVGAFQSVGERILPDLLAEYRLAWPAIDVSIHTNTFRSESLQLLRDGRLDLIFVDEDLNGNDLDSVKLFDDPFVVAVPAGHRLAKHKTISLLDLASEDLIDGLQDDGAVGFGEQAMQSVGIAARVAYRTDDNATRQRLVAVGLGCAVLPKLSVRENLDDGIIVVVLKEPIARAISLAWISNRAPSFAATQFIEITKQRFENAR
jgi:DNA-binding transcriptional LysR family regulator